MIFSDFAKHLQKLEQIDSRLEMTAQLAELYKQLAVNERRVASYLMLGSLVPPYESLEFQLSSKMVMRALAKIPRVIQAVGARQDKDEDILSVVSQEFRSIGDLGLVAAKLLDSDSAGQLANAQSPQLNVVYEQLVKIAQEAGVGSQDRKIDKLVRVLSRLDGLSAKFVVRIVIGKLRLGFSTMTMLDALSWAKVGDKTQRALLEKAYNRQADVGVLAETYLSDPDSLADHDVVIGSPVVPALCQRLTSASEIIEKMSQVLAEPKYDGLRVQVHITKDRVKAFTRNLEEVSAMFPELEEVKTCLGGREAILDTEAIGYDAQTGQLRSFQKTITRKRKHQVGQAAQAVPVRFYAFDLLALDDQVLLDQPLSKRRLLLEQVLGTNEDRTKNFSRSGNKPSFPVVECIEAMKIQDPEELRAYHNHLLAEGLEGVVAKKIDSFYRGGRKGWRWVKLKEKEGTTGKLADTLDLVVMGYYFGQGKRTQFGLGAFLAGVLDKKNDFIKTVAKIGTGLTEQQLKELKLKCDQAAATHRPKSYLVPKDLVPNVWVEPELVAEVAADEITKSPIHTAGWALRFPRLVRFRADKSWQESTALEELVELMKKSL